MLLKKLEFGVMIVLGLGGGKWWRITKLVLRQNPFYMSLGLFLMHEC